MNPFASFLNSYRALNAKGVMGMNRRNIDYIGRYNSRSLFPLVDDKLKTKRLALEHEVVVPSLIGVVDSQHAVKSVQSLVEAEKAFCIKPAKGSGGKGILVISKVEGGVFYRTNGQALHKGELQRHVSNILAGLFSLGGAADVAMIEACIQQDEHLATYSYEGVPDIRVIVFRGVPIMAMMRLSCSESHGKANLHQGAIGVGLCLKTGRAVNAVCHDDVIEKHPDTGQALSELALPRWNELLHLACACADMTGLGYLGVDLVIDKNLGPMLLELNARPGLSIQIANGAGLLPRLREVERIHHPLRMSIEERIAYAQERLEIPN
ncbi:MAG: alpha-L-glutamate ligase-like protein [Agarilytica sp.]